MSSVVPRAVVVDELVQVLVGADDVHVRWSGAAEAWPVTAHAGLPVSGHPAASDGS